MQHLVLSFLLSITDEDEKTDVNNPKSKMSPAEYRRIHPYVISLL